MDHCSGTFWPMIILMILFSYIVMSNVMLTFKNGTYNHINKLYMAFLMGALMGLIHYIIMLGQGHHSIEVWYGILLWTLLSVVFIVLIRKQTLVNDTQFLKGMTEHHDMALLMSERIKEKTDDQDISEFAQHIIDTQQAEIDWMKNKLSRTAT